MNISIVGWKGTNDLQTGGQACNANQQVLLLESYIAIADAIWWHLRVECCYRWDASFCLMENGDRKCTHMTRCCEENSCDGQIFVCCDWLISCCHGYCSVEPIPIFDNHLLTLLIFDHIWQYLG